MDSKDAKSLFAADVNPAPRIATDGTKVKPEDLAKNPTWAQWSFARLTLEELWSLRRETKLKLGELDEQVKILRQEVEELKG